MYKESLLYLCFRSTSIYITLLVNIYSVLRTQACQALTFALRTHDIHVTYTKFMSPTQHSCHLHNIHVTYTIFMSPTRPSCHLHDIHVTYTTFMSPTRHSCHLHNMHVTYTPSLLCSLHRLSNFSDIAQVYAFNSPSLEGCDGLRYLLTLPAILECWCLHALRLNLCVCLYECV